MPPKKKSVKKTKKIKKAKLQKEQTVNLFADFDVLGEEKKEHDSTSLSPDIQNDNIISKLEDDESDKDSPDVSAHTSQIEATEVIKENEFVVDGSTRLSDLSDMIGFEIESEEFDSIGGYVIGYLGRMPKVGEEIKTNDFRVIVEELDRNRVKKVRVYTYKREKEES